MTRAVAGALLATAAALGCARPGTPPGGEVDRSPPRVVATVPAPFDTLTDLRARVVIEFDERISERLEGITEIRDAVLISPVTGEPRAKRRRSSLEIVPAGGWEADRVYRVVVLPVFRDLFGNRRQEPIELVFSTGAPIPEIALAGFVADRITGEPVPEARVAAVRRADGSTYLAVSDTSGFFAMRYLPAGAYDLRAWVDQDRDGEPDFFEAQDTADTDLGATDTMVVELAVLPMDTTPARLARAEAVDSTRVRLVFDDHFAPGPVEGSAALFLASDSSLVTSEGRLVHGSRLDSILAVEQAARDSARAEEARQDSLRRAIEDSLPAAPDSVAAEPAEIDRFRAIPTDTGVAEVSRGPEGPEVGPTRQPPDEPLPSRELILLLPDPLLPDSAYYVEVEGVVNIRGLPGGGGSAAFVAPPPPADEAAVDTTGVAAPPDTTGAAGGPR